MHIHLWSLPQPSFWRLSVENADFSNLIVVVYSICRVNKTATGSTSLVYASGYHALSDYWNREPRLWKCKWARSRFPKSKCLTLTFLPLSIITIASFIMAPHTIPGVAANKTVQGIPTDLVSSEDRVHAILGSYKQENQFVVSWSYSSMLLPSVQIFAHFGLQLLDSAGKPVKFGQAHQHIIDASSYIDIARRRR